MTDKGSTSGADGSGRVSGSRGNPAPRRALARVRPLDPGDVAATSAPAGADVDTGEATSAAAGPGGTQGRDLLIPSRGGGHRVAKAGRATVGKGGVAAAGKSGPAVPSLADLMPAPSPSGRRTAPPQLELPARPRHKAAASAAPGGKTKTVELLVTLPKPLRKRLKTRAAQVGLSPEEAVAQLVEVWVDG
jgi:hypothetical protein